MQICIFGTKACTRVTRDKAKGLDSSFFFHALLSEQP